VSSWPALRKIAMRLTTDTDSTPRALIRLVLPSDGLTTIAGNAHDYAISGNEPIKAVHKRRVNYVEPVRGRSARGTTLSNPAIRGGRHDVHRRRTRASITPACSSQLSCAPKRCCGVATALWWQTRSVYAAFRQSRFYRRPVTGRISSRLSHGWKERKLPIRPTKRHYCCNPCCLMS
jgi:hypothetical protein